MRTNALTLYNNTGGPDVVSIEEKAYPALIKIHCERVPEWMISLNGSPYKRLGLRNFHHEKFKSTRRFRSVCNLIGQEFAQKNKGCVEGEETVGIPRSLLSRFWENMGIELRLYQQDLAQACLEARVLEFTPKPRGRPRLKNTD